MNNEKRFYSYYVVKKIEKNFKIIDSRDVGKGIISYTEGRKMDYLALWRSSVSTSVRLKGRHTF